MEGTSLQFFVPFDGSDLAVAALERAATLADGTTADIVVATVVPRDRDYAVEQGWLGANEGFDSAAIEETLGEWIENVAPGAEFRCVTVNSHVSSGGIATRLRDIAMEIDADVVFLGSENVGSVAASVSSIGSNVATRVPYDIYLVQQVDG